MRVVCGLSETMASLVPTRRLSSVDLPGVGTADERDEPGLHGVTAVPLCASPRRSARVMRTLCTRRRSASSTSTCSPLELHVLARRRHAAEVGQQESADRLEALALHLDPEALGHVLDVHLAAEHEAPVALVDDRLGLDVVLVADLADDLLEQILDGHEARRAAVLVDDDGRSATCCRWKSLSRSATRLVSGTKCAGRSSRGIDALVVRRVPEPQQVLREDEAEHVVEGVLVDRARASTPARANSARRSRSVASDRDGHDVGTRRHHLADERVAEVHDRLQQRALLAAR